MTVKTVVALAVLATAGSRPVAAPEQTYPGQPTKPRVWIENHGPREAVPVSVQDVAGDAAIRAHVVGTPSVSIASPTVFDTRPVRQTWEYQRVTALPGEDLTLALNRLGREGWELASQYVTARDELVAILKRPAAMR